MTETPTMIPLADALQQMLAGTAPAETSVTRAAGKLVRTGQALVTIRNAAGLHLVYRLRERKPWVGKDKVERPGIGYWIDCREVGHEWTPVGVAFVEGHVQATRNATTDRAIRYAAEIVVAGLAAGETTVTRAGRDYTLHVEDRCGKCGLELTDPISIERGYGPTCYGRATGSKSAR